MNAQIRKYKAIGYAGLHIPSETGLEMVVEHRGFTFSDHLRITAVWGRYHETANSCPRPAPSHYSDDQEPTDEDRQELARYAKQARTVADFLAEKQVRPSPRRSESLRSVIRLAQAHAGWNPSWGRAVCYNWTDAIESADLADLANLLA